MSIFNFSFSTRHYYPRLKHVLLALFVVLFTSQPAAAQTIDVSASVSAPLPSGPAVITSPANQSHQPQITTSSGTCPTNGAYVVLQRRAARIGTASCENGEFTLPISLVEGTNEITAQIYNITDDPGPNSDTIIVYYDAPLPPQVEAATDDAALPIPLPAPFTPGKVESCVPTALRLSHASYSPLNHKERLWQWSIAVTGGCPPYQLNIEWGDGSTEKQEISQEATISLSHTYNQPGSFNPTFTFTDSAGTEAILQLLAVVARDGTVETINNQPATIEVITFYEVAAYSAAAVVTVTAGAATLQAVHRRIKKP